MQGGRAVSRYRQAARPDYFVENQFDGPNRHDKLSPAMSALILFAHVKQGTELAAEPTWAARSATSSGSTTAPGTISYFYAKALDLGENPRLEDYATPGPGPRPRRRPSSWWPTPWKRRAGR
ncbi:MAG: hypothetical protein V8Q84_07860 [Bilophila sp.]